MFLVYLTLELFTFILSWYIISYHLVAIEIGPELSDWISVFISSKEELFVIFLSLLLILFLLHAPLSYAIKIIKNTKVNIFKWESWKALSLLIIIFDIYLYIVLEVKWFFLFPFLTYYSLKQIFSKIEVN